MLIGLMLTSGSYGVSLLSAQTASHSQVIKKSSLLGHVVDTGNMPVGGAHLVVRSLDRAETLNTLTDAAGDFALTDLLPGRYTVEVDSPTLHSKLYTIIMNGEATSKLRIGLDSGDDVSPAVVAATPASQPELPFSDKPDFTVAGVTDWTAVGGHGSDATLRASEDLTRETLALTKGKSQEMKTRESTQNSSGDTAERTLRAALNSDPTSYTANRDLGLYYLRATQFSSAIAPLTTASELNRGKAEDEYHLALACQGVGDLAQARQHVQHALLQQDTAKLHHLAGNLDENLGDPLSAVHEQERATQLDPSEDNYFAWASELLLHRAIWQAVEVFAEGSKAHPVSARMKTGWGAALFAGARYTDAAQQLCEASDLDPRSAQPYIFLGKVASSSEAPLLCVGQRLARFLTLNPDNAVANYTYAIYLHKYGGWSESSHTEHLLRKVIALNSQFTDAYLQLGIISFERKDYPQAVALLEQAIKADPTKAEGHYRLGIVYDRMGDRKGAEAQFRLHDQAEKTQEDATEQQRRDVKQFLIVSQATPTETGHH